MKITEALFAEHLVFHSMFDQIEAKVVGLKTLAEVKGMAALMEAMLKAHSEVEDELFLGPLEHCFEQIGQRDSFLEEHREMNDGLQLVQTATRIKQAQQLLLRAVAHSRKHFDREERIVFPLAERVLKSATLTELGQSWLDQRNRATVQQAG
jgi:hemerythrin-like domain-containing protein